MERMTKEKEVHLEGAKVYGPQDYEVVDEMKILKEENKKLKSDLAYERTMLDNVRAEYKSLQNVIKKLKKELKKYKKLHKYSNGELLTYKGRELMEEDTLQELKDIGELNDEE